MKAAHEKYSDACTKVGLAPNLFISKRIVKNVLHVKVEKIHPEDWQPVFKCLENDSSLVEIIIEISAPGPMAQKPKFKSSFNVSTKNCLLKSLASCLTCSSVLQKLSIISVPLKKGQLAILCKGLSQNKSLTTLCLKGSLSGHTTFKEIFPTLRKSLNISHLDLSCCKLNEQSCELIGCLLRSQGLERHSEAWQHTLRYNIPDLGDIGGIKRITLNANPIGDDGCELIATALQDDYWVKALDFQQCNLSDEGAKAILVMIQDSISLCVLDLRLNQCVSAEIIAKIDDIVSKNQSDRDTYTAYDLVDQPPPVKPKPVRKSISNLNLRNTLNESLKAKKASSYEKYYSSILRSTVVRNQESLSDVKQAEPESEKFPISVIHTPPSARKSITHNGRKVEEHYIFQMLDELKNDLKENKAELYKQREINAKLEMRVNELERENVYLKKSEMTSSGEIEPELLETIESSFNQFHGFLDLLKDAGYGDLCKLLDKSPTQA